MGTGSPSPARRLAPTVTLGLVIVLGASVSVAAAHPQPAQARSQVAATTPLTPVATPALSVAPLGRLVQPDVLITASKTLSPAAVAKASRLSGVTLTTTFAYGTTQLSGARVTTFGVDPSTFRAWAVETTAKSDPLWKAVAQGELTTSFDAAKELKLPLGGTLPMTGRATLPMRLGAFDTVGLPDADAVVSKDKAQALGLPANAGMLVSAPAANMRTLTAALTKAFGTSASVRPLRALPPLPVPVATKAPTYVAPAPAAEAPAPQAPVAQAPVANIPAPASGSRLAALIAAAKTRMGMPYVYGAAGPYAFDCSGFTQWSFAQIGISLPRSAAEQWVAGPHVSYAAAQPGDVLAWAGDPTAPGYVTHVALYLGGGMMIVAATTGTLISIQPVYTQGLLGAIRFL
ncbi:MAG: Cell wall-associated hydrolase (invasion-associated protein)-like protein [Mycobacterium sp.]|nr:Cell wall-associated hydrolase (invasion-associated protein)-like protein [Mycobacterium sp.]